MEYEWKSIGAWAATVASLAIFWIDSTWAQSLLNDRSVEIHQVEPSVRQQLAQVDALMEASQWLEGIDRLQKLEDAAGDFVIESPAKPMNESFPVIRYISFAEYCSHIRRSWQTQFPEAWRLYQGAIRNEVLQEIADIRRGDRKESHGVRPWRLASSEQAMDYWVALGDYYQSHGWLQAARWCYQNSHPTLRAPIGDEARGTETSLAWHLVLRRAKLNADTPLSPAIRHWFDQMSLVAPEQLSSLQTQLASLWARLCWCSLVSGDEQRSLLERSMIRDLYPNAKESGSDPIRWIERTDRWLESSRNWRALPHSSGTYATFAGQNHRSDLQGSLLAADGERVAWQEMLPRHMASQESVLSKDRPSESSRGLLVYHPVVHGQRVYANLVNRIVAFDLATGTSWPSAKTPLPLFDTEIPDESLVPTGYPVTGAPRGTLTIAGEHLYGRVGSPVTAWRSRSGIGPDSTSQIVGLDLSLQGKLLPGFPLRLQGESWEGCEFEGTPIVVGDDLFVGITRRNSVHIRRTIACFDRYWGTLKWHSPLIAAAVPEGVTDANLISHQLLTYMDGRILYSTGLGIIASIDARNGKICWLCRYDRIELRTEAYPRSQDYRYRDLAPILACHDQVICAPSDRREFFALDWGTGALNWACAPEISDDMIHLLGIYDDQLIASGQRLGWFDVHTGHLTCSSDKAAGEGLGRGCIASDKVVFPTNGKLLIFEARQPASPLGPDALPIRTLSTGLRGSEGCNVVSVGSFLIMSTPVRLVAIDNR